MTTTSVIEALRSIFARYGIPEMLISDNGPQYSSKEFAAFTKLNNFHHATSSPLFPQSNGQAEQAVQTVKKLLRRLDDPYMALLTYRSTPVPWCIFSPSELLMGRRFCTTIPTIIEQLTPAWQYLDKFRTLNAQFKQQQKEDYDRHHRSALLPPIPNDTEVWVTSGSGTRGQATPAQVIHCEYSTRGGEKKQNPFEPFT